MFLNGALDLIRNCVDHAVASLHLHTLHFVILQMLVTTFRLV